MWLLVLEALAALAILVFIVAWTMSGRRRSEEDDPHREAEAVAAARPPDAESGPR